MGMFSWNCPACGFSIRDCRVCSEDNWMGEAVVLTVGGSRIIGQYDGYGTVGSTNVVDQIDQFAMYHKECWELAGRPEFEKPSEYASDQGFCLSHDEFTVPKPTSVEWLTAAREWQAIRRMFGGLARLRLNNEYRAHEEAYKALSETDKVRFEDTALSYEQDYRKECDTFEFDGEVFNICAARTISSCALRDRGEEPYWFKVKNPVAEG